VSQELILPSVSDLLAEAMGELSDPPSPTAAIPEAPKFVSRTTPAPAVAPKPASALSPATAPKKVSLASPLLPSAPKVKPAQPKATMAPMLGGLSAPSLGGAPALKLSVPEHLEGQEVEIVVQVRHAGAVVAESQVKKSVPAKGSVTKLTVEMKRS
jgi:hypothetical protein